MSNNGEPLNELDRLLGRGRKRAIEAMIDHNNNGTKLPDGLNEDDFRCDAEQVGLGKDGQVSKSWSSKITDTRSEK